jgi:antitoxin CptB
MSGAGDDGGQKEKRRRKLAFRSWHRGMREADLILGAFADAELGALTAAEIDQYERLLETPDTELLPWLTGERALPPDERQGILLRIRAFSRSSNFKPRTDP